MATRKDDQDQKNDRGSTQAASPQKGAQGHAEGQHGDKTHARIIEQLHEGEHRESREDRIERNREQLGHEGGRRLVEDREQHDEAEKNSEHTQSFAERGRGRDHGPRDSRGLPSKE